MPAELRLHRLLGVGARLQRHRRLLEFGNHLAGTEIAEVAAVGFSAGVGGVFVGQLLEIGAVVELLDDGFRLFLRFHENVTGMNLVDGGPGGDFLVVARAHFLVGDLADDVLLDHLAMQRPLLQEGRAALEVGILVEPVLHRLVGEHLDFDRGRKCRGAALVRRKLRELLGKLALGKHQVGLGDRLAVDRGDHGLGIDRGGRRRSVGGLGRLAFLGKGGIERERREADGRSEKQRRRAKGQGHEHDSNGIARTSRSAQMWRIFARSSECARR